VAARKAPAPVKSTGFWLVKSEPESFSWDDLWRSPDRTTCWDGVRNYAARNFMRDGMKQGDLVLFYHSSVDPPGVAGLARIVRTGVVDETQFDPTSPYHDPTAKREEPRWICVDVEYVETLPRLVALDELRANPALADMLVLRRGMRLSVQPVTAADYKTIVAMARKKPPRTAGKAPPKRPARRPPGPAPRKKPAR
jgi:predicted RNA-binding protein with PUA-like domain